jgi:hypothetical protein
VFSRQHGEDNLLDWVQLVCLRDDACDWAALQTGFGVLKDAWMRFQRKHPRAPEHVVAALLTLMNRIRPCADDSTIAQQMDEMLQAYKAEWDDSVAVASDEDMHSPRPCTPERVPRANETAEFLRHMARRNTLNPIKMRKRWTIKHDTAIA